MSGILFLVRKFCNVEIMPMVVVGRWRHKGGSLEPHPIFIFQTIFISNLITMIIGELREPVAKFDIIPNALQNETINRGLTHAQLTTNRLFVR